MKTAESFTPLTFERHIPAQPGSDSVFEHVTRTMPVTYVEVAGQALNKLWHEMGWSGEPLIFQLPPHGRTQLDHHPLLLNQLVAAGQRRKRPQSGQLERWERLDAPTYAHGIAATGEVGFLYKSDLTRFAVPVDLHLLPAAPYSWLRLTFKSGWQGLSVYFFAPDIGDGGGPVTLVAIPEGCQDEYMAFLRLVDSQREAIARRERRGRIEIIGGMPNTNQELVHVIETTSFNDVVLPEETLAQIVAQRRIFDKEMLRRYADLHVPRLRKVLLIGPPGTGKTTLLKAEGARHAKRGGLVLYVCAPMKNRGVTSWQQLSHALRTASESRLPTLVLVEDFEMFVSDSQELQLVLNTLDGAATPDNRAGTLLLATSNEPEKIDPRIRDRPGRIDTMIEIGPVDTVELAVRFLKHFLKENYREEHATIAPRLLKQPGSHLREVCIGGAMHAIELGHEQVESDDLLWSHEAILHGRMIASQSERFMPAPTQKRGGFFGRER